MSKKKKPKEKKPRNWHAVNAFNRKAGAMKNKEKKKADKDWKKEIDD